METLNLFNLNESKYMKNVTPLFTKTIKTNNNSRVKEIRELSKYLGIKEKERAVISQTGHNCTKPEKREPEKIYHNKQLEFPITPQSLYQKAAVVKTLEILYDISNTMLMM